MTSEHLDQQHLMLCCAVLRDQGGVSTPRQAVQGLAGGRAGRSNGKVPAGPAGVTHPLPTTRHPPPTAGWPGRRHPPARLSPVGSPAGRQDRGRRAAAISHGGWGPAEGGAGRRGAHSASWGPARWKPSSAFHPHSTHTHTLSRTRTCRAAALTSSRLSSTDCCSPPLLPLPPASAQWYSRGPRLTRWPPGCRGKRGRQGQGGEVVRCVGTRVARGDGVEGGEGGEGRSTVRC